MVQWNEVAVVGAPLLVATGEGVKGRGREEENDPGARGASAAGPNPGPSAAGHSIGVPNAAGPSAAGPNSSRKLKASLEAGKVYLFGSAPGNDASSVVRRFYRELIAAYS